MLPRTRTMTARKTRSGSVRTIREDAAETRLVLASNRRLFGSEQSLEERFVETYAEGPILGESHRAGRRPLRLADVLAPGPRHLRAVGPAGSRKMGCEQRRVTQGAL